MSASGILLIAEADYAAGIIFWIAVIALVVFLVRRRSRACPRCGNRVAVDELDCPHCGFDFRSIGAAR